MHNYTVKLQTFLVCVMRLVSYETVKTLVDIISQGATVSIKRDLNLKWSNRISQKTANIVVKTRVTSFVIRYNLVFHAMYVFRRSAKFMFLCSSIQYE